MSSQSSQAFECRWRASGLLLALYLLTLLLAVITLFFLPVPLWLLMFGLSLCLLHAAWTIPSRVLLCRGRSWRGLRHDQQGWSLWSQAGGWQPVQLLPDSIALPLVVVLRFKRPGDWFAQGVCIPHGAMAPEQHRRLRLRLKFSRRRWAAPG
ncbi:protein YgfX [Stutzerimonas stutzeri]|uniref:protein YgfX n=1 Tax=Stutzerimonas stutzeri TaxID=316 RepID=UPI0002DBA8F8|nr:protein YgfX [Stutzerimonas stutzeri]